MPIALIYAIPCEGHPIMQLTLLSLTKSFGHQMVLRDVSLSIQDGERIGIVGPNGAGKSTLLHIIAGLLSADSGRITTSDGMRIGHLAQHADAADSLTLADRIAAAQSHLLDVERELRQLEARMGEVAGNELDAVMTRYGDALQQFEHGGGYAMAARVDAVLDGLGVGHLPRDRQFGTLSGGEKARVALAMLILSAPDIMLLDEPTNHLDDASLMWLEETVREYRGAALIASHDRHFLNQTATSILDLNPDTLKATLYAGNYDTYQQARAHARKRWELDYARQQEEIHALREELHVTSRRNDNYRTHRDGDKFVYNFKRSRHDATVSKRVRSAQEQLDRIEADPIPRPPDPLEFRAQFDPQLLRGRFPLEVVHVSQSYGERTILHDGSLTLRADSRVLIRGANGTGKTTLLRIIAGQISPDSGTVSIHPAVNLGYLDQEQADFAPADTAFEAYRRDLPQNDQTLKAMLLSWGLLRYDDLDKLVSELSIGMLRKIQIARLIASGANLLLLDEPTNHISLDVLEELETALAAFPGPILAVSHDRHFIKRFGGEVWELRAGKLIAAEEQELAR
jgi:macrolide transport system ATP-binding/permease protein